MNVLFLLFVIAILLLLIFWELSKINSHLKKTHRSANAKKDNRTGGGMKNRLAASNIRGRS